VGGELYIGNRDRGIRNGLGTQTYRGWNSKNDPKYHTYYGNWVDGKREGKGQLTHCKLQFLAIHACMHSTDLIH
jgi:hypothetical protein